MPVGLSTNVTSPTKSFEIAAGYDFLRQHYQLPNMRLHVWNRKMCAKNHLQSLVLILPTLARIYYIFQNSMMYVR